VRDEGFTVLGGEELLADGKADLGTAEFGGESVGLIGSLLVAEGDAGSGLAKEADGGCADAAGASGDEGGAAGEGEGDAGSGGGRILHPFILHLAGCAGHRIETHMATEEQNE